MLKKLIASASAAAVASTSLLSGLVMGAPVVTDPELIDAISWGYDNGLTSYSDASAFMPYNNLTREQFAKFASEFASSQLDVVADTSKDCSFSDESSFDSSLTASITMACQQGLMMGSNGVFMAKQLVTRGQVATVFSRMLGEIDALSSEQAHFDYLKSIGVMNVANLNSAMTRGDVMLVLYRLANSDNGDLCTLDPTLPGCTNNGTGSTNTGTVVKAGDLQISLNPSTPANMTSIPRTGVSKFATVDFTAGSKDISLNTIALKRSGLGSYTNFSNGRMYFEVAGIRVSGRSTVSSDDTVSLSFAPSIIVPAGKTVSVDLMAELANANIGAENKFTSTVIDSSAATVNGKIETPTLRTADYAVRSIGFTNYNSLTTYQGSETTVELGKFQLQNNAGANTIDTIVKTITVRNVGNGTVTTSLKDVVLLRAGSPVSTKTIINGRDVTFVLLDTIKDGQTATYTIQGKVADVENASGDTYKFVLRQSSDINAIEATTEFRTAISIATGVANDTTTANQYTVNGGELRFARDTSLVLSQNVSAGQLNVDLMKGTITAKQPILLEDVLLDVTAGSSTIHNVFKKVYLQIGSSTFTWTPDATTPANNAVAEFDGSVTVNGTVPVRIYADVYSNLTLPAQAGPYKFESLDGTAFTRKEYVSNQNALSSNGIGTISASSVAIIASTLSVTKYDNNGSTVRIPLQSDGRSFYAVRLTNNQTNDVKVGSITLTPSNAAFSNNVTITLKQGSTELATKTLNGATTFNGLNIVVKKGTPVDLTFVGNFTSNFTNGASGTFGVTFNAGDVLDNVTSNAVTVNGSPATSATVTMIDAGTINVSSNTTIGGIMASSSILKDIGTLDTQAVNDTLELRGVYINVNAQNGFTAGINNAFSNYALYDGTTKLGDATNVVTTASGVRVEFAELTTYATISGFKKFTLKAAAANVDNVGDLGDFKVSLADSYDDVSYADDYKGMRLYSIAANNYVASGNVSVAAAMSNTISLLGAYPVASVGTASINLGNLASVKLTNGSDVNKTSVTEIKYNVNTPTAATLNGKKFSVQSPDGSVVYATGTFTTLGADVALVLSTAIDLNPGETKEFSFKVTDSVSLPANESITMKIQDVKFSQNINGSIIPAAYFGINASKVGFSIDFSNIK